MTPNIDPVAEVTAAAESVVIGREPAVSLADASWLRENGASSPPDAAKTPEVSDP